MTMEKSMSHSPASEQGNGRQNGEAPHLSVILTIRLLMQGKEVGSIIGKRGDHIKNIRDDSSAKINISDGSCPERIVTITGSMETINKAFAMICRKFEDDMLQIPNSVPKPPITMRMIVPATQCGSLIGKGGSKIKEIREATGASIQVASEMLPNSTERAVTISGTCEAIIKCMVQICHIMLESPPKGATIPYRPKPTINPLLLASSAAAAAAAAHSQNGGVIFPATSLGGISFTPMSPELTKIHPLNPMFQPVPSFNPAVYQNAGFLPGMIPTSVPNSLALEIPNQNGKQQGDFRPIQVLTEQKMPSGVVPNSAANGAYLIGNSSGALNGTDPNSYIINTSIAAPPNGGFFSMQQQQQQQQPQNIPNHSSQIFMSIPSLRSDQQSITVTSTAGGQYGVIPSATALYSPLYNPQNASLHSPAAASLPPGYYSNQGAFYPAGLAGLGYPMTACPSSTPGSAGSVASLSAAAYPPNFKGANPGGAIPQAAANATLPMMGQTATFMPQSFAAAPPNGVSAMYDPAMLMNSFQTSQMLAAANNNPALLAAQYQMLAANGFTLMPAMAASAPGQQQHQQQLMNGNGSLNGSESLAFMDPSNVGSLYALSNQMMFNGGMVQSASNDVINQMNGIVTSSKTSFVSSQPTTVSSNASTSNAASISTAGIATIGGSGVNADAIATSQASGSGKSAKRYSPY